MKDIEFATLNLQDALDLAILIEKEAAERYEELADQMSTHHTDEAAKFFRVMVVNELKHGNELAARRKQLFGDGPSRVDGAMMSEIEAPEYEKVRVFMSIEDALNVALEAEKKAYNFFVSAIEHVENADVLKLFQELRQEEIEHQEMVKSEMKKLPPRDKADIEDYADEPVGQ
ncbi:MAG: ferritin family protein [Acidobacteria bacterium]|nr:ferritin family protein [Acidobacteriota bacterium]